MGFRRSEVRILSPRLTLAANHSPHLQQKLQQAPGVRPPGALPGKPYGSPLVHQWYLNWRFAMTKKPFFRSFDGCWYVQTRVGQQRRQVKLLDEKGDPVRGQDSETAA